MYNTSMINYTGQTCGQAQYTRDGFLLFPGGNVYHPDSICPDKPLRVWGDPDCDDLMVEIPLKRGKDNFVCESRTVRASECWAG